MSSLELNFSKLMARRRLRQSTKKGPRLFMSPKDSLDMVPFCLKGMKFNKVEESDKSGASKDHLNSIENWKDISNFILTENPKIFRGTLSQMNKTFYEEFENSTLKAFNLDHLKEEDFAVLKRLGLRRQNLTYLNQYLDSGADNENTLLKYLRKIKNLPLVVEEIVNTKVNDSKTVLADDQKIYVDLINAYRSYVSENPKAARASKSVIDKMKEAVK